MHHCAGLFSVTGPVVEDVSVGRIAPQQTGAGERTEKDHLAVKSIRKCDGRSRCAHVANDRKNLVLLIEPLHCLGRANGLIAVIGRYEFKLSAMHTTASVGGIECSFDAQLHILAELFSSTAERCRNSKPNFIVGYAAEGRPDGGRLLPKRLGGRRQRRLLAVWSRLPDRGRCRWLWGRSRRRWRD